MRKRYGPFDLIPPLHHDMLPMDMGDGTFVLVSGLEKLRGITPNEIRAQEAQEEAASPGPVQGFPMDPERASEREWHCLTCMTGGSGKDQIAADAALNTHRDSPEHDRAVEKSLRCRLEAARTALYDYLKSKGRVA